MAKVSVANNVTRSNRKWIIGYSIAGFLLFITYQFLIPWDGLPSGIYQVVNQWMPPSAVNESLVYVIMSLALFFTESGIIFEKLESISNILPVSGVPYFFAPS